ncbi:MAG TPA: hypothetical protein VK436_10750, partial [Methanocella sp.]|nr:hypothetical protein [Methanocella sp.]
MGQIRGVTSVIIIGILIAASITVVSTTKVDAWANILDDINLLNNAPNGFEPSGWNTTGTAAWLDVKLAAGWNTMK